MSMPVTNPLRIGLRQERVVPPQCLVIFGASGDLTHRKLVPALFELFKQRRLPSEFAILGCARRPWTDEIFKEKINNKNYSEAYNQYSEKVKANSDSTYWLKAIDQLMIEFGKFKSRELSSSKFENTIDGLGDGFYVFLEFKSLYQNINLCDEYVLLGQNDKLKWKILRYDFSYESNELDPDKELPNQSN